MAPRIRRRIALGGGTPAALLAALAVGCAAAPPPPAPPAPSPPPAPARAAPRPGWPETWGIDFAFRCARRGDDLRFCACVAEEVQARWTPEELEARGPGAMDEAARACHARLHDAD
ncbi:MAG TPA: hypothetical protein VFP65_07830 [Anaeromyxobacteraceae bacterium]|nr:hypothetical protein [Anaeromyxobacteraceae bacterium]